MRLGVRAQRPDHPHRWMGPLHRRGRSHQLDRRRAEVTTGIRERLSAHESGIAGEALVELDGPDAPGLLRLESQPVVVLGAETDRHGHPPAREPVDAADPGGQVPRPIAGGRREQRAEPDPLGPHCGRSQLGPGVLAPDGLPGEDRVPAGPLGERGELDELRLGGPGDDASESHPATLTRPSVAAAPSAGQECRQGPRRLGPCARGLAHFPIGPVHGIPLALGEHADASRPGAATKETS